MFVWKSDLSHSSLQFAVSHMVIAEVVGFIRNFDITIETTKADFSDAKVEAIIDTRSIFTNITDRDQHLMSADFLDSERYPQIRFVSTNFKNIAFPAIVKVEAGKVEAEAKFNINRKDWGMEYGTDEAKLKDKFIRPTVHIGFKINTAAVQ